MVRGMVRVCALAGVLVLSLAALLALGGCGNDLSEDVDPAQVDAVTVPANGVCRNLTPDDVEKRTNATRTVDCAKPHTAETYAVGELPSSVTDEAWGSKRVSLAGYYACNFAFAQHLGAEDSTVMRTVLSWAWFRPSEQAWKKGARWYRCDIVGGTEAVAKHRFLQLPTTTKDLLRTPKPKDKWMVCGRGISVSASTKVPCNKPHDWRAATTIKVGDPFDDYPGDRAIEVKTREFCRSSISAWLNYPVDFQFGYTWFHKAEWEAGNRRSICWARTDK